MQSAAQRRAARLLEILDLQQVELNLFLGANEHRGGARLFGGQVLAQAAMAAYRTVADRALHSLHAYFLKGGTAERPVLYEVERIRDGKSFTTRRVVAVQGGEAIFNMDVSFQVTEAGFEHARSMPNVPLPDELQDDIDVAAALGVRPRVRPFETRSVFRPGSDASAEDRYWNPVWIRFRGPVPDDDPALARCLLAYASDMGLVSTTALPHQSEVRRDALQMASLDHAVWIHRDVAPSDWLLLHKRTASAHGSRGMVHAELYTQTGELVASVTQEGLVRLPR